MLASLDWPELKGSSALIDQVSRIAGSDQLGTTPQMDASIVDSFKQLPDDFLSKIELARNAASLLTADSSSQVSSIQDQLATLSGTIAAPSAAAAGLAAATASFREAINISSFESTMSSVHLQDLSKPLLDSWMEVSSIHDLAPFRSDLKDLADQIVRTSELWKPLRESSDLRFALASLTSLKNAIDLGPFADSTIAALQDQLGDWSASPFVDPSLDSQGRLDRYLELGLEPRLVSAPPDVFHELLDATELREEPARLPANAYLVPEPDQEDQPIEEEAMIEVHRRVRALESRLRELIDREMTAAHGGNWISSRTPPDALERARERRAGRLREGPIPQTSLLLFVDFGDYQKIICRKDNWPLFKSYFLRPTAIEESFARLTPLRSDDSHSRTFSCADHLIFHAEILRLHRAMDQKPDVGSDHGD